MNAKGSRQAAKPSPPPLQGPQQLQLGSTARRFTVRCRLPLERLEQQYIGVHAAPADALQAAARAFLTAHRVTRGYLQLVEPLDPTVYRAQLKRGALQLIVVGTVAAPEY